MQFSFPGFAPQARDFLCQLRENNDRKWFRARKSDYERYVREPLIELVAEVGMSLTGALAGVPDRACHRSLPRKSVYRIYRDIRFSKNKAPYKTHAAAVFPPLG